MSVQRELEALFVKIKTDTSELLSSAVQEKIKDVARFIIKELDPASIISPSLDMKQVKADFKSLNRIITASVNEANKLGQITIDLSTKGKNNLTEKMDEGVSKAIELTNAAKGLEAVKKQISDTIDVISDLARVGADLRIFGAGFERMMQSIMLMTPDKTAQLKDFAQGMEQVSVTIKSLGFDNAAAVNFHNTLTEVTNSIVESNRELRRKIKFLPELDQFVAQLERIKTLAATPMGSISIPTISAVTLATQQEITKLQALLNTPLKFGGLQSFLTGMTSIETSLKQFVPNLKAAMAAAVKAGGMPELKAIGTNATTAATGLASLNAQLAIYTRHMSNIRTLSLTMPHLPGSPTSGGGGGPGGGIPGTGSFGFNPIRRGLSVATGIASSMALGFFGFEMVRQVTDFDEHMTRAMSVLNLHMRGAGLGVAGPNIRRTVESDILLLSRRVATGPQALAQAFNELTAAGYGTAHSIQALAVVEQFAFVSSMDAAQATKELTTLQRQLGLVSDDATQNATNLRKIADTITSASLISGMAVDHFTKGLVRLTPHVRFLNGGLEDSVGLLAAFGRLDATNAASRAEQVLRGITTMFLRSETGPLAIRSGGAPGRSPIGPNARPFRPGQGVHPVHQLADSVRLASEAWRAAGINVFDRRNEFIGVAAVIQQIDAATRNLNAAEREQLLIRLQLHPQAAAAIRELLSSGEAMEQFTLAARRADGVMAQVANERLQSFNSQASILKNNITVLAVELGKVLAPVLRVVNGLLIENLDAWWNIGGAGRLTIVALVGVVAAIGILRFAVPFVIAALKVLFWDTLVTGATIAYRVVVFSFNLIMSSMLVVRYTAIALTAVFRGVWFVMRLLQSTTMALSAATTIFSSVQAFMAATTWLGTFSLIVMKATLWAISIVWAVVNSLIAGNAFLLGVLNGMMFATSVSALILKGVVWLLNFALTTLGVILTVILTLTGLILIAIAALIIVFAIAAVAIIAVIAVLVLLVAGLLVLMEHMGGWRVVWRRFVEFAQAAFWAVVGFLDNFQHNMEVLMGWMDQAWPAVILNITNFANIAFQNLWLNVEIGFARMIARMVQVGGLNRLLQVAGIEQIVLGQVLPARERARLQNEAADAAGLAARARGASRDEINAARRAASEAADQAALPPHLRQLVNLGQGFRPLPIPGLMPEPVQRGLAGALSGFAGGAAFPNRLRLDVSTETREMIEGMFTRPRTPGQAGDAIDAANKIGATFKEISLNRFVLEGPSPEEAARREELRLMEEQNRILRRIEANLAPAPDMPANGGADNEFPPLIP